MRIFTLFLALFLIIFFTPSTLGQDVAGTLDESFGEDGIVRTDFRKVFTGETSLDTLSDGRIVLVGTYETADSRDIGVMLFEREGKIDSTFGNFGLVVIDGYGFADFGGGVIVQPDEKILILGTTQTSDCESENGHGCPADLILTRIDDQGNPDISFGTDGVVYTNIHEKDFGADIKLSTDGKIIICGTTKEEGNDDKGFLVQYNADGTLDVDFGVEGIVEVLADYALNFNDMAIQTDGKIVIAGEGTYNQLVVRFNADGSMDGDFAENGIAATESVRGGRSIVIQSDGKILVLGTVGFARYHTDGRIDSTLNEVGIVSYELLCDPIIILREIALQSDGKIIVVGTKSLSEDPGYFEDYAISLRYNADGSDDTTYGNQGLNDIYCFNSNLSTPASMYATNVMVSSDNHLIVLVKGFHGGREPISLHKLNSMGVPDDDFGDTIPNYYFEKAHDIVVRPNGKFLITGYSDREDFMLVQYNVDGDLDEFFGENGLVLTDMGGRDYSFRLLLRSNGKSIVVGWTLGGVAVVQYLSNGDIDSSFGVAGKILIQRENNLVLSDVVLQEDGKLVIAFYEQNDGVFLDQLIARYNVDGSLDMSFGDNGVMTHPLNVMVNSLIVQSDGKIITVGRTYIFTNDSYSVLSRINENGSLDSSFGENGSVWGHDNNMYDLRFQFCELLDDGKILVGGESDEPGLEITKFNSDGSVDVSFGVEGRTVVAFDEASSHFFRRFIVQPDNKIIVPGTEFQDSPDYFSFSVGMILRFTEDGLIDTSFGYSGIVFQSQLDWAHDGEITADSSFLVCGGGGDDIIIAKIHLGQYVGINSLASITKVSLYPNPTRNQAILEYSLSEKEQLSLQLYDLSGKLVQTFYTKKNKKSGKHIEEINFDDALIAGQYFLTFSTGKKRFTASVQLF